MTVRGVLGLCLVGCLAACAARQSAETSTQLASSSSAEPAPEDAAAAEAEQPAADVDAALSAIPSPKAVEAASAPAATDNLGTDPYAGVIDRAGLVSLVEQGMGRFLTHLRLSPVLDGKRFVGFAIAGLDPAWGDIGLAPGDVLLKVNGQPIERPEQAMAVFESLRVASEVAVEFTRAGVPATLRFRIE